MDPKVPKVPKVPMVPKDPKDPKDLPWPRRAPRFPAISGGEDHARYDNRNDEHMWCLMLTLIIMCGSAVLVAVLVSAIIFMGQNK